MIRHLIVCCILLQMVVGQKFYECKDQMKEVSSDMVALEMVKEAVKDKFKFSSACLELLLKKNFMETSEYLLNEYYPTTSIDTEIIVRSVANDIQRNQDYVIFKLKQKMMEGKQFPTVQPMIYFAQSVDEVLIEVKLHPELDTPTCKQSFDREVFIEDDMIRVQAYCMQFMKDITKGVSKNQRAKQNQKDYDLDRKRDDESIIDVKILKDADYQINKKEINFFDTDQIELLYKVDPQRSSFLWDNNGVVQIKLRKADGN